MRNLFYNFLLALFLCGLVSLLLFAKFDYPLTGIDDANIYFVYARNLADGHGFVYNAGGERVEGFTSLLWTGICAVAFAWAAVPELFLLIVNIVILSLGIAAALTYLQNDFLGRQENLRLKLLYSLTFLILLLTSPRYIAWNTITLMENGLWSTLLLVTTIFTIKGHRSVRAINLGFIPLAILLILTRPESMVWVGMFTVIHFMRLSFASNSRDALKALTPSILCIIVTLAVLTLFRLQYFGYPLPNTYYAKVSPSLDYNLRQGFLYLSKYVTSDPIVGISVISICLSSLYGAGRIFSKQAPKDGALFLPLIAWTGLLTPLLTGGDHFGSFRLYQNIYPIEVLCLFYVADRVLPDFLKSINKTRLSQGRLIFLRCSAALVLILLSSSQVPVWNFIKTELDIEFRTADYGRKNGSFIQGLFSSLPGLPSLGVVTSGGIKYSYSGEVVDLMGLNNVTMGHNPGDRRGIKNHAAFDIQTFYKIQPDILWPRTLNPTQWQYRELDVKESWENRVGLKGLFDETRFLELYSFAEVSRRADTYILVAWFKKDLLKQLETNPEFRVITYQYTP